MENLLFLGVPILKHIRVDQLAQMQRLPVILSMYHSKFSVPPTRRTYADGVSILSLNRKTGVAGDLSYHPWTGSLSIVLFTCTL